MFVKNLSKGSTAIRTREGIIVVAPGETKELNERNLLTRLHHSLAIVSNPDEVAVEEDTTVVVNNEQDAEQVSDDGDNDVSKNSGTSENETSDESLKIEKGHAPTKEDLEKKLKSLKASWSRAKSVKSKELISKEIKEIEKQIAGLK